MKKSGTRLILTGVVVISLVLIAFRLKSNRQSFENEVAVAQRQVDRIAVAVDSVHTGTISDKFTATGVLEASEMLNVVSETQGRIVSIYREKGQSVNAGDVILKVDDEVIAANVLTAEANYAQFEKDIERLTRLSEENAVTKRDLEQAGIGLKKAKADLITARKALGNTSIKAPISGYINNDYITVGQFLGGGSPVCEIVNNSKLKLNIKVTEHEVYKIKNGQAVAIHLSAFPEKEFTGHITSIAEKADMAMKFNVEITLANNGSDHLKSGLYAEAILPFESGEKLIIRKAAILGSMEKPVVFTAENGVAVRHDVVTGNSNNDFVEVLSGLSLKDLLIVSGQLNIKNGDNIRIVD
jgi:RND family efflux transporter MFP subunit